MNRLTDYTSAARLARRLLVMGAIAALPALYACDDMLEVEDPEFATPESLANPDAIPTLVAGAIGDFQVAYSGGGNDDKFLSTTALITDEFFSSGTFTTRTATDRRSQFPTANGNTSDATYVDLHQARRSASEAAAAVAEVEGSSDPRISTLKTLEGFTYVALGEAFCSNIPFSTVEDGVRVPGEPLTTAQVFSTAADIFDEALSVSSDNHAAAIGKARALLNNGEVQAAADAVAGVPTDYVEFIEHSANSGRQTNPIFALQSNGRYSVSDNEGGNGIDFRSAQDPRVPWVEDPSGGFDPAIPLYLNLRYITPDAQAGRDRGVVLADGIEARLIEAEAELASGGDWLGTLNDLRADVRNLMAARYPGYEEVVPGPNNPDETLPDLTDPGSQDARVDMLFRERAFWLFNTGHRLGDMRRLIRDYGRDAEDVYPSGAYHKSGAYGPDVNFPVDFDEANNENYQITMCSTTTA